MAVLTSIAACRQAARDRACVQGRLRVHERFVCKNNSPLHMRAAEGLLISEGLQVTLSSRLRGRLPGRRCNCAPAESWPATACHCRCASCASNSAFFHRLSLRPRAKTLRLRDTRRRGMRRWCSARTYNPVVPARRVKRRLPNGVDRAGTPLALKARS
eukprot:363159-Chlamydomonas_euryale.AAC.10